MPSVADRSGDVPFRCDWPGSDGLGATRAELGGVIPFFLAFMCLDSQTVATPDSGGLTGFCANAMQLPWVRAIRGGVGPS